MGPNLGERVQLGGEICISGRLSEMGGSLVKCPKFNFANVARILFAMRNWGARDRKVYIRLRKPRRVTEF